MEEGVEGGGLPGDVVGGGGGTKRKIGQGSYKGRGI